MENTIIGLIIFYIFEISKQQNATSWSLMSTQNASN